MFLIKHGFEISFGRDSGARVLSDDSETDNLTGKNW